MHFNVFNREFRFLLCAIDIYSKNSCVVPLKDKRKPNKIWLDKGSEFYHRSMKSWLQDNGIEMFSTYNEGKYVVAEKCVENSENRIYKYMNLLSKNATY